MNLSFAFTDPALDWDVSNYMQKEGVFEVGISQVTLGLYLQSIPIKSQQHATELFWPQCMVVSVTTAAAYPRCKPICLLNLV